MDLSKLTSDEAYALLDEVPLDIGSFSSGAPSVEDLEDFTDEDYVEDINLQNRSMDENSHPLIATTNRVYEWDSKDDVPIINFIEKAFEWTVPEDVNSPTDVFFCLCSREIIDVIVFQTNLYATNTKIRRSIYFHKFGRD